MISKNTNLKLAIRVENLIFLDVFQNEGVRGNRTLYAGL